MSEHPQRRRIAVALAVAALAMAIVGGHAVRTRLDFAPTPASIQAWVAALGWEGPVLYVLLFIGRQFLLLPAGLLLPVAGLCFGVWAGTALATFAIVASGLTKFLLARAVRRGYGARLSAEASRIGPAIVGLATAHPLGPLSWSHWAAGLSSLRLGTFAVALAVGAPVRAFALSYFGAALTEPDTPHLAASIALLGVVVVLPLLHPGVRQRLGALRSR